MIAGLEALRRSLQIHQPTQEPKLSGESGRHDVRLLFATAEACPTFRADVNVLFGKYLPRYGIRSDIIAERAGESTQDRNWSGGKAFLCEVSGGPAKRHLRIFWHDFRWFLKADAATYQAVQVRDMPLPATMGLIVARFKNLPFFYWMSFLKPESHMRRARENGLSTGLLRFVFRWMRGAVGHFVLYRIVLPGANHVFVQSDRMLDQVAAMGIERGKMTAVPMAVDGHAADPRIVGPAQDERLSGKRVLVYLGTLDRGRGIERLFEMLATVRKRVTNVLLVLVGDTDDQAYRAWLELEAARAGVADAVVWTGWLPVRTGWTYVRAAEIGLSPIPRGYLDVGTPTKVLEYLSLGIPVVGNDNPDQATVIRESSGGMCVPYTARAFADAVATLLSMDRAQRDAMAEAGRAYVLARRDYDGLARRLAQQYGLLCFRSSGSR
jgi:glycosyltransferase involved in cell wall biosynthesis